MDAEREAFEAWMLTQPGATTNSLYRRDMPGALRAGEYCNGQVEFAWLAWQGRAAADGVPVASSGPDGWLLLNSAGDWVTAYSLEENARFRAHKEGGRVRPFNFADADADGVSLPAPQEPTSSPTGAANE